MVFVCNRTKYEAREKQQQSRVTTLEKEKKSLHDELASTVNELTQVQPLFTVTGNNEDFFVI